MLTFFPLIKYIELDFFTSIKPRIAFFGRDGGSSIYLFSWEGGGRGSFGAKENKNLEYKLPQTLPGGGI